MKPRETTTCLVLGGRGFVGSAIAAEAQRRGYSVLVVDKDDYAAAKGTACDLLINANGNSKKYLAAQDPALEFDLSVSSVVHALQDFKADRVMHLSSIDVYPSLRNPALNRETTRIDTSQLSPYGFHKFLAEELVRYYARHWIILRMGGFVGPGLWKNSVHDLLRRRPLRVHLDSEYQYLHTRDFASILFDLVEMGLDRELLNLAGDGVVSLRDVAALIPDFHRAPFAEENLPLERYEVCVDNVKQRVKLPTTADTVRRFVQDVLAGKEKIA